MGSTVGDFPKKLFKNAKIRAKYWSNLPLWIQKFQKLDLFFTTFSPRWLTRKVFQKKFFKNLDFCQNLVPHRTVGSFPSKMLVFKHFKIAQWEIFPKNCSKT